MGVVWVCVSEMVSILYFGEDVRWYGFVSISDVSTGYKLFVGLNDCICNEFSFLMNVV